MDKQTALRYVDEWANFFLRILEGDNLELIEKDYYTILRPKKKEKWASIFNIRLEHLHDKDLVKTVKKIKKMKQHVWWNQYSDRVNAVIFPDGRPEVSPDDDEVYAVMQAAELPAYPEEGIDIRQARTLADFELFHSVCFDKYLAPGNTFDLFQKDMIRCYIAYMGETPVAVTAMLKNGPVCSLEFTTTLQAYQRKGFARAICQAAIKEAFRDGAEVVTIRAGGGPQADNSSKGLGRKLGFSYI